MIEQQLAVAGFGLIVLMSRETKARLIPNVSQEWYNRRENPNVERKTTG